MCVREREKERERERADLWTEIGVVVAHGLPVVTVDVLHEVPVAPEVVDVDIDDWHLLHSGRGKIFASFFRNISSSTAH